MLVLSAGTAACDDQAVGAPPDAGFVPDAGPVPDAWVGPDGMACEAYAIWHVEAWPIQSIELFDAADTVPVRGRTFRVRARHAPLPLCHYPGRIYTYVYYEEDGFTHVSMRSHVWVLQTSDASAASDCPPVAQPSEWIVPVHIYYDDTNAEVRLSQIDYSGTLTDLIEISYPLTLCPPGQDCGCEQSPEGYAGPLQPCDYDCQCQRGLFCLPASPVDPASSRVCQRPCTTQHDCLPDEICYVDPAGPNATGSTNYCEPAPQVTCTEDADCPVGHQCLNDEPEGTTRCVYGQADNNECCFNSDCGPGAYCTRSGYRNRCYPWCLGIFGNRCNHCNGGFWSMTLDC